jgi:hypothetical protein
MFDDHYIPNAKNAHIDVSVFERELRGQLSGYRYGVEEALEFIYELAFSTTSIAPKEPDEGQLMCRYLSLAKFLQFRHTRYIHFPMTTQFSDHWECRVPEEYEVAVLRVLRDLDMPADGWSGLVSRKAAG